MKQVSRRRISIFIIAVVLLIYVAGCSRQQNKEERSTGIPVEIKNVTIESNSCVLEYIGIVAAEETKNYSFKMSGKIEKIHVTEGQDVSDGDILVGLENKDLVLALNVAENISIKARKSYEHAIDCCNRINELYKAGAVTVQELEKVGLETELLKKDWENAEINCRIKRKELEDSVVKSEQNGFVSKILIKEGEMCAAGHPVIVVRGKEKMVKVGVDVSDIERVQENLPVKVSFQGEKVDGVVQKVFQIPDMDSGTYCVEIAVYDISWPLGAVVKVFLDTGENNGIFIPVKCIMRGQEDFVYVINGDKVEERPVIIGEVRGEKVKVQGLQPGEKLVVSGMGRINAGDTVIVLR